MAALAAIVVMSVMPAVAEAAPDTLQWGSCPADAAPVPGLQCATLDVPLDYRHQDGTKIQVAISRLASKNPGKRRGVLMLNPGGPGGPGLDFVATLQVFGLPQSVLDSYDIIGFDPRGIGHSTPVTCDLTPEQQHTNVPPYAHDAADVAKRAEYVKGIAHQCGASATASQLPYTTTANTARDMDRIRAALGVPKLSYYGVSYGTYLGAVYTTLFPQRGDRIVLDSNLGPGGFDVTASRRLAQGFQDRFPDFAKFAAAHNAEYGLGATPEQVTAKYFELAERLDKTPVLGIDGVLFRTGTFGQLYNDAFFPILAQAWQQLDRSGPAAFAKAKLDFNNVFSSQLYVVCGDNEWPESVVVYQRHVAADRIRYPMFGAAGANIWPCAFWPSGPVEPPVRIGDRGPSDVLMVQNLRDPATPLVGALELRRALGDRVRMVVADQGGHGAYLFKTNACLNDTVTTYLTEGKRPLHDTFCVAEPSQPQSPAPQKMLEKLHF